MTVPNSFSSGTTAESGKVNENFEYVNPWTKIQGYDTDLGTGIIKFSSTIFNSNGGRSTDAGVTFSSGGYGATAGEDIATSSGAIGIAADQSDGSLAYTTDSGSIWQAASTGAANVTTINCLSLFNTTIGVAGGTAASGNYIWYTSDGGINWAQSSTGPTAEVTGIVMASATVGYAVDSAANIWKTTNGGDDWTDTTDNFADVWTSLTAIDTDTIIGIGAFNPRVQKYVNSTNTITYLCNYTSIGDATTSGTTNIIKATNGNYYWAYFGGGNVEDVDVEVMTLFYFDGTNVFSRPISIAGLTNLTSHWLTSSYGKIPTIIEVSNKLYLNAGGDTILEIPVTSA